MSDKGLIYKIYKELTHACMQAMSLQSCPPLFDPMDRRMPGSSAHETLQARILEWVAFPSPGDLPDPGIKPESLALPEGFFTSNTTWEAPKTQQQNSQIIQLKSGFIHFYKGI